MTTTQTTGTKAATDAERKARTEQAARAQQARQVKLSEAAAARFAALPGERQAQITGHLASLPGYSVIWPKPSWSTLRLTDPSKAPEGSPEWVILCNAHGVTKALRGSRDATTEGRLDHMRAWCKGHKADVAKAAREATKADAR